MGSFRLLATERGKQNSGEHRKGLKSPSGQHRHVWSVTVHILAHGFLNAGLAE
ncbi:hypothetical protein [Porphyrobacter sp. ULC335]|uniref:hypothetical protein n=1 Tax=Porphyrobacter sp. ULC335 TaxID=2854260 RepID=UPI00221E7735|nr:hypothetical protein [Porphyrobacter sp. ULC335]UYV16580.1 hypothetical protein KVF90_04460 [Porphyrobacter sp. ULC335]